MLFGKKEKKKKQDQKMQATKIPVAKTQSAFGKKEESGFQSKFAGDVGSLTEPKQEREIASPKEATLEAPGNRRKTRTKAKNTKLDKAKKAKIKAMRIPKSSQDTLPYLKVFRNGIFMSEDDVYTKTYTLTDANFKTATQDHQDEMYFAYGDLLNYFQPDVRPQFTIFNTKLDKEVFRENTLFEDQNDGADDLRHAMNAVLEEKINEGQNNIVQKKFITVGVAAENIQVAANVFSRVDTEMVPKIQQINGDNNTEALNLVDRLTLLYNIYNQSATMPFYKKMDMGGKVNETFNLEYMLSLGLTTKDLIAPMDIQFYDDYFLIDDKFGRALGMRTYPTQLSAEIMTDLASVPCTALTSVHFSPMRQDEAITLVRNQMLEVTRNMATSAEKKVKKGLSGDFVPLELKQQKEDADKAFNDFTVRNQKSILATVVSVIFADTYQELENYTKMVINNAEKHMCSMTKLNGQQEAGLASAVPLGVNRLYQNRMLNTEAAALFIPFEAQEMNEPHGLYYGVNQTSHNLVVVNRLEAQNSNGLIIGMSGSGKSFAAKMEMAQAWLKHEKNEIFVIDPQAEYKPLCERLNGQVIRIAPGGTTHINPFDMDLDYASNGDGTSSDDPVTAKSDYIGALCEAAIGGHYGLNPVQQSVIDRCVRQIYTPYLEHMDKLRLSGSNVTCDRSVTPTLKDFYEILRRQPEPDADYIRIALEKYCVGSYDTFAHHTNVDTNRRFIVYDISDIGTGLKEMGMQVCLEDIWNRTVANKKRGVRTWIFIDEFYLLTQSESCARHLMFIYKQARKFGGVPTGITQNVEDMLTNRESRAIINNCQMVQMLNQSDADRKEIGTILHVSETQLDFIKNAQSGHGLIWYGGSLLPFANKFPTESPFFELLSTKPQTQI